MKLYLYIFCVILSATAWCTDLDAPPTKPVTIRTEIDRGVAAGRTLAPTDTVEYDHAISAIYDANEQKNTDTDAFKLGLYFQAWESIWFLLSRDYYPAGPARNHAAITAHLYYAKYSGIRKKLGLTDDQVRTCFPRYGGAAEDALWEAADSASKYSRTYPDKFH